MSTEVLIALITACSSLVLGLFSLIKDLFMNKQTNLKKISERIDTVLEKLNVAEQATKGLLRQSILERCDQFIHERNIPTIEFERLQKDYETYEKMVGENGFVDLMMSSVRKVYEQQRTPQLYEEVEKK